jgi:membrane protein
MAQLERTGHARKGSLGQTAKRTLKEFQEDNVTDWAAALTYYGVLAMFPALIALVSIVGLVGNPASTTKTLTDLVTQIGPASAAQTFSGPIQHITQQKTQAGIGVVVGILAALWSASGYVGAFMRASNVFYEVDEGRPIWKLRPLQMLVTLVLILLLLLCAIAVIVTGPLASAVGNAIGVGHSAVTVWNIAKWPVVLVIFSIMLSILYYASPNAKMPGFKFVTPGGLFAVLVWVVASALFAFYVSNFSSYDKTYGTLAGVVLFLVWMWITNVAILLGHELNAERERSSQIEAGTPGAETELQLPERDAPKESKRPSTA